MHYASFSSGDALQSFTSKTFSIVCAVCGHVECWLPWRDWLGDCGCKCTMLCPNSCTIQGLLVLLALCKKLEVVHSHLNYIASFFVENSCILWSGMNTQQALHCAASFHLQCKVSVLPVACHRNRNSIPQHNRNIHTTWDYLQATLPTVAWKSYCWCNAV